MAIRITFNEEKNQLLKATRDVGFDEILDAISEGGLLADIANPSINHADQRLYAVKIKSYIYAVPYVINSKKNEIYLKTAYPSRVLTKRYIKGE